MHAYTHRSFSVSGLLYVAWLLSAGGRRIRLFAKALGGWLERRRAARVAREQLSAMSERELQDIGIGRSEIERIANEPSTQRARSRLERWL